MTDSEAEELLKPLDSRDKLLAFIWKDGGEDGVLELYGEDLCPQEFVASDAAELRRLGFKALSELLTRIASTMPPRRSLPDPSRPHSIDLQRDQAWQAWLEAHQDDERAVAHDQRWKQARRDWERRTGTRLD